MSKAGNIPFVRLAHVDDRKRVTAVETGLQLDRRDLGNGVLQSCFLGPCLRNAAEFFVVYECVYARLLAAHGARRILSDTKLTPFELQSVEQLEPACQ